MEQYIVSARKYRPTTFSSVVGQQSLASTLKNAITTGRLAHAYLFCGGRGVGKTSCARIFAKTINCLHPTPDGEACNECESCLAINNGNSMNLMELDAASNNGVDDIRNLIDQIQTPPSQGKYRVVIIDEVHMLSAAAFNAFLKTLEEPPAHVIFILATTEKHKIIPTILSRCQIYDFNRITVKDITAHLGRVAQKEGIQAEAAALNVIARQADGAMRDALSIFDQVAASCRGNITYQATIESLNVLDSSYYTCIVEAFEKGDIPSALLVAHQVRMKGFDGHFFINGLADFLRSLMLASNEATITMLDVPEDIRSALAAQAARLKPDFLYAAVGICADADLNYRLSANKQLLVELTLIRIAQLLSPSSVKRGLDQGLKPIPTPQGQATAAATPAQTPASKPAAPTPTAAPAATAAAVRQPSRPTQAPGIRIGLPRRPDENTTSVKHAAAQAANNDIDPRELEKYWLQYAEKSDSNPLRVEMNANIPTRRAGGKWVLDLTSIAAQNLISIEKEKLMPYLRQHLNAPGFNFAIELHDTGLKPEHWSEKTVLEHMRQDPVFNEFFITMGLSLR